MTTRRTFPLHSFFTSRLKPLAVVLMLAHAGISAAAGSVISPGRLGSNGATAKGVSADGSVVVGGSNALSGNLMAFRWENGVMTNLGTLGGSSSEALAVSGDGSTVVGYSGAGGGFGVPFRWVGGVMTYLGTLGGNNGYATDVSHDGSVVVGWSRFDQTWRTHAFRWQNNVMQDLGTLGGESSDARAVSADGSVVVGAAQNAAAEYRAFRWQNNVMSDLGVLNNGLFSEAYDVSADGSVVVGVALDGISGLGRAFRWEGGVMADLGALRPDEDSAALGVSGDGRVVVGYSGLAAFRWTQAAGMQSVSDWLRAAGVNTGGWTFTRAYATNRDGSVVVGVGDIGSGSDEAFIARVGGASATTGVGGTSGTTGVVGLTDLAHSLTQTVSLPSQSLLLTNLALNGAHHRTLMETPMAGRETCAWASGDFGGVRRNGNGTLAVAEVGICRDFADRSLRVGVGVGTSHSRLDLANNGRGEMDGNYVLAEADWAVPDTTIVASLLGYHARWDAVLKRGYAAAGTVTSQGSTTITDTSLRARIDWRDAFTVGNTGFTPSLAYTHSRIRVGAYDESGGSAPATFSARSHDAAELRASLSAGHALDDATKLRGTIEAVHRFDRESDSVAVSNVLGVTSVGVTLPGSEVRRDWLRLGIDVDHRLDARSLLSFSGHVASAGHDADVSAGVSYKFAF